MKKIIVTGGSGFIGTHLINELISNNFEIINIDINKPQLINHEKYWINCNILNKNKLTQIIKNSDADFLVHLAAKTDTLSSKIEDYSENTIGVENIVNACNQSISLKKIIITSTQYVYKSLKYPMPKDFDTYIPHTIYGQSKVISEQITKERAKKNFVIIRPTNIWGPYNKNYANGLFRIISNGIMFLPKKNKSFKSFGYVKNVAFQINKIICDENLKNTTMYVGGKIIKSDNWVNLIHLELKNDNVKKIPNAILFVAALFGEILKFIGISFPFYLTRYNNMLESYLVPIDSTIKRYGLKYSDLKMNVKETIDWYKNDNKK